MDHLKGWRRASARFADVLDDADLTRPVPACPEWHVADLAFHVGRVLDRFRQIAADRLTERDQIRGVAAIERPAEDAALPGWFRQRVAEMDAVLADLGPDEPVWNFSRAPHVGAWVPRRMHHELVVHRHDLETAVGESAPIDGAVATDGLDELMAVLAPVGPRWEAAVPATLQVADATSGRGWTVRLAPGEHAEPVESSGPPDVLMRAPSPTMLLVLWRRRPLDAVAVTGDADLAEAMLATIGR